MSFSPAPDEDRVARIAVESIIFHINRASQVFDTKYWSAIHRFDKANNVSICAVVFAKPSKLTFC